MEKTPPDPILTLPFFVNAPRHGNDIRTLRKSHPGGCPPAMLARALGMREADLEKLKKKTVATMRKIMVKEDD